MPAKTQSEIERAQMIEGVFNVLKELKDKSLKAQKIGINQLAAKIDEFNKSRKQNDQIEKDRVLSACLRESGLFGRTLSDSIKVDLPFNYWRGHKLQESEALLSKTIPASLLPGAAQKQRDLDQAEEDEIAADASDDFIETRNILKEQGKEAQTQKQSKTKKEPEPKSEKTIEEKMLLLTQEIIRTKNKYSDKTPTLLERATKKIAKAKLTKNDENKIADIKKMAIAFQNANPTLSDEELSKIFSYCIDESDFFVAKLTESSQKLNQLIIAGLKTKTPEGNISISYQFNTKQTDIPSVVEETERQKREIGKSKEKQVNVTPPPKPKMPPPIIITTRSASLKTTVDPLETLTTAIKYNLLGYKKDVNNENKGAEGENKTQSSRLPWSSNQARKFEIVDNFIKNELNKPLTSKNMGEFITALRVAIKANQDATGNRLFHRSRRLDDILKGAEKKIILTVPNGYAIDQLNQYIEKAKKEDVENKKRGPLESDRKEKVKLANELLQKLQDNQPLTNGKSTEIEGIKEYLRANKTYTKGEYGGFHRAGKLDAILNHLLNDAEKKEAGRTMTAPPKKK